MIQHDARILLKPGWLQPEHPEDKGAKAKPTGEELLRYLIRPVPDVNGSRALD